MCIDTRFSLTSGLLVELVSGELGPGDSRFSGYHSLNIHTPGPGLCAFHVHTAPIIESTRIHRIGVNYDLVGNVLGGEGITGTALVVGLWLL